jgi:hypothetical protein
MSCERLSILTPSSISIDHVAGFSAMNAADVAYCLSGIGEYLTRLAMCAYIYTPNDFEFDCTARQDLVNLRADFEQKLLAKTNMRREKASKISMLVTSQLGDGRTCCKCNGNGKYLDSRGIRKVCGACEGGGKKTYSIKQLSKGAGVKDRANFERQYLEHYKIAHEIIQRDINFLSSQIRKKLNSD